MEHDSGADAPTPMLPDQSSLTRRRFLRGAAITGGGLLAAGIAACAPGTAPSWTYPPAVSLPPGAVTPPPTAAPTAAPTATPSAAPTAAPTATAAATAAPSPSATPSEPIPAGWSEHDIEARTVVRRYVGDLAPALKDIYGDEAFAQLVAILGAENGYPELSQKPAFVQVPQMVLNDLLAPLTPVVAADGAKEFALTIDEIEQRIDELKPPVAALGFNGQWPGPTIRVTEGDKVRISYTNNLKETTGIHHHGMDFTSFFMDGIPFLTQLPITPGETFTYEFTARPAGSHMYHSHHNATDQVGRGLLGALIVDPVDDPIKADRDYTWISNDTLGGFTINGHGFPAVVPVLAAVGETVRIRFMNEGLMMHPWHSHGYTMRVVARDGRPLGNAEFDCDTLGVNPGERWDALITVDRAGLWAFHCHILTHVEGLSGMFGMVTAMIVVPDKADVDTIVAALLA